MADKSKMQCNRPVPSDKAGKKKMVKGCSKWGGEAPPLWGQGLW